MKARRLNLTVIALILTLCAFGYQRGRTAPTSPQPGRADSLQQLTTHDWWAQQNLTPFSLPADLALKLSPPDELSQLDPTLFADTNARCWAVELLGRSGKVEAVEMIAPMIKGQSWQVRAAARLALARLNAYELAVGGLQDPERITLVEDERVVGQGGRAVRIQPVVLATLKGLSENQYSVDTLPYLLKGLRVRPIVQVSYDSTPEPFPDTITESNPLWFRQAVSQEVRRLGWSALPAIQAELGTADVALEQMSGGRFQIQQQEVTVHSFLRSLAPGMDGGGVQSLRSE